MNDVIDFKTIDEQGPQTYERTFDLSPAEVDRHEVSGVGEATIKTTVRKGDLPGEYVADGVVTFAADLACSRCVEPYPFASTSDFHVRLRPRPEVSEENEEIEITDAEELDVEYYAERSIPLRHLALEQIQLSIPMKPLCDEGCLGLCPTCGANLAREQCACETSVADGRWGALQGIREQLSKKKDV